jgi:glycosyltransferase involved in cell wall biosynthesis
MNPFYFIANNNISDQGLSGGDRIFIELARRWKNFAALTIIGSDDALAVCRRENLKGVVYRSTGPKLGLKNVHTLKAAFLNFFKKLWGGLSFVAREKKQFQVGAPVIYSVSDFYPDLLPAFWIKRINPRACWIAGFYLFASPPWRKDTPYKGVACVRGFLYWFSQRLSYFLVARYADVVFVTSAPDQKKFVTRTRDFSRVIVVKGGVAVDDAVRYQASGAVVPVPERRFDACFVGRFHVQKGVMQLLDIWREVLKKKPKARLAMVGDGPFEGEARCYIQKHGISENVEMFGFLDGQKKFEIFKQSRMILHPAIFDSGGMAAAEAMAWRLPGISFDLEALKTYYPRGMMKVPLGDNKAFADTVVRLLDDPVLYSTMANEAFDHATRDWSWDARASSVIEKVFRNSPAETMETG